MQAALNYSCKRYYNNEDQAAVAARHGMAVADVEKCFGTYRRRAVYADYLRETI